MLKNFKKYKNGIENKYFNTRVFWKWLVYGAYQSLMIAMVALVPNK